ncbi:InlB B-repeat-containing protein [Candidatus Saccharibacteria bacterium]|nr:InlB B-repeat-containing protein [Candidatus Saccharibacteria bacterium]
MRRAQKALAFVGIITTTLFAGWLFTEEPVFGVTDATIGISVNPQVSLNMMPGDFGSVSLNVGVTTDNYTGYTVNLTNTDSTASLTNTNDSTLMIPTIALPDGSQSITSDMFVSGYGISTDGINYLPAPVSSNNIQIGSSSSSGTGQHALTFGIKPAADTVPGLYERTFVIVALVNNPQYSITYLANAGADTVSQMPSDESVTVSSTGTVTLPSTIPVRSGYLFLGWDTDDTATNPTYPKDTINTITLEPTQSNSISLYAIWEKESEPPVIADYTEEFSNVTGPTATATTQLNNMSPADFVTKIFAYTNNTGRTISSIKVEIVYSKSNQGATSGSLIGKLNYNGTIFTANPVTVDRGKVTNKTVEIAQFNNLNIPSSSNVSFTIGTDSDAFTAGITISSQTITVTFAD